MAALVKRSCDSGVVKFSNGGPKRLIEHMMNGSLCCIANGDNGVAVELVAPTSGPACFLTPDTATPREGGEEE
jgi:hypothetical protein